MSLSAIMLELSFKRKLQNYLMKVFIFAAALLAIIPLFFLFFYVIKSGLPALNIDFFISTPTPVGQPGGGMANSLVGSALLILLASIIGIPLGIFGGVFLSEYGKGRLARIFRFIIDLLTSIPSIVVGLFVYSVVVVPMKTFSAYAGAIALSILMFPFLVKTTEEVLKLIPQHVREAGLALGIPRWRVILSIVLKGSMASVATGVLLGIARIAGETAPLLFTAFGNRFWPHGLTEPIPSLPVQIYNYAISPYEEWHRQAWAGAFLLMLSVFLVNTLARILIFRDKTSTYK